MEIKYELHLGNFHIMRELNGVKDVVVNIEYTYSGSTEVEGHKFAHGLTRSAMVMEKVEDINHDNVIDFNDITQEMALQWVYNSLSEMDIASMKGTIRANLENQTMYGVRMAPWIKPITTPTIMPESQQEKITKE